MSEIVSWVCRKSVVRQSLDHRVLSGIVRCCFPRDQVVIYSWDAYASVSRIYNEPDPLPAICSRDFTLETVLPELNPSLYPGCLQTKICCKTNARLTHDRLAMLCQPFTKYNIRKTILQLSPTVSRKSVVWQSCDSRLLFDDNIFFLVSMTRYLSHDSHKA